MANVIDISEEHVVSFFRVKMKMEAESSSKTSVNVLLA
jgi:hypothetical protein